MKWYLQKAVIAVALTSLVIISAQSAEVPTEASAMVDLVLADQAPLKLQASFVERWDVLKEVERRFADLEEDDQCDLLGWCFAIAGEPDPKIRWIDSPRLARFYVRVACDYSWQGISKDAKARALGILVTRFTDRSLRTQSVAILDAAKHTLDGSYDLLLGKTGAVEALEILGPSGPHAKTNGVSTSRARAKLGVEEDVKAILEDFKNTPDSRERMYIIKDLGYIASPATVMALVRNLRSTAVVNMGGMKKSVRGYIVRALHAAYPTNTMFATPYGEPTDQQLDKIEAWANQHLGITWEGPRPAVDWRWRPDDFDLPEPPPETR